MVGRAAQGRPWILGEIAHFLATGVRLPEPGPAEVRDILLGHLAGLHGFTARSQGVRIARKHLGWYAKDRPENRAFLVVVNRADSADAQLRLTRDYFDGLVAGVAPDLAVAA
jgi:tRNA-dihydrouridine synthase B